MDEMFRRAAENYPLDTSNADWNKISAALKNEPGTNTISEKNRNKNGRFLWLLLLLPLGLICNQLYSPESLSNNATSKSGVVRNTNAKTINAQPDDNGDSKIQNSISENISPTTPVIINATDTKGADPNTKNEINFSSHSTQEKLYSSKSDRSKENIHDYNNNFLSNQKRKELVTDEDIMNDALFLHNYVFEIPFHKKPLEGFSTSVSRDLNPLFHSPKSKENIQVARRKKFYAGIIGGIDATTVKFQKIEDAGFSYGFLFGYQFNKKWSVETGAFLEKKYYYSDGKYLNISKLYMPPNSWIGDASGNCKMIEVPVAVKYNFSIHKNSTWFATLGASSYIMKKENYTYNYYYGTVGPVPHKKEYYNSSVNLFSAVSVSGGYTHRLGSFTDVRIEPYLKLPISGMGTGDLPLFSTGLQIGVARKF